MPRLKILNPEAEYYRLRMSKRRVNSRRLQLQWQLHKGAPAAALQPALQRQETLLQSIDAKLRRLQPQLPPPYGPEGANQ